MNKKIFSSFKQTFSTMLTFMKKGAHFFKSLFSEFGKGFTKRHFYILASLFILSISCGFSGFYYNSSNLLLSLPIYVQDEVYFKKYVGFGIECPLINKNDSNSFKQWSEIGNEINYQSRTRAFAVSLPFADNNVVDFTIDINGRKFTNLRIGDFFSYRSEAINSYYFSSVDLRKYDNSSNGQNLLSYNFEGKSAGSYIPSFLAEWIIDTFDDVSSFDDVLGMKYSLTINGSQYNCSINNIYFTDNKKIDGKEVGLSGELFEKGVKAPIISNLPLYECFDSRLCVFSSGDSSSLIRMINSLRKYSFSTSDSIASFFIKNDASFIAVSTNSHVLDALLKTPKSSTINVLSILFSVLFFSFSAAYLVYLIIYIKRNGDYLNIALLNLSLFCLYLFATFLLWLIVRNNYLFYSINNVFVATFGFLMPLIIFVFLILIWRMRSNEENS